MLRLNFISKEEDMTFVVGDEYIYNFKKDIPIIEDDWDNGIISDAIFDNYATWSEFSGERVTVLSHQTLKTRNGCQDSVKVYMTEEDEDWWFIINGKYLTPYNVSESGDNDEECTCDLSLIMVKGCQCGAEI
jgi:hypothetical protein